MRAIINNLLYDTDKSELIFNYFDTRAYKTRNGKLFRVLYGEIVSTDIEEIKNWIGKHDPDAYIKLFGEVEEA